MISHDKLRDVREGCYVGVRLHLCGASFQVKEPWAGWREGGQVTACFRQFCLICPLLLQVPRIDSCSFPLCGL